MLLRGKKGFTLIELLVVVALIAVLSATGYATLSKLAPRYRTYQAAREFASTLTRIRAMAASDGVEHRIVLSAFDEDYLDPDTDNGGVYLVQAGNRDAGSSTWEYLPADAIFDHTDDDVSEGTVDLGASTRDASLMPWSGLTGPNYPVNADCIVISPRGWLTNPNGDFDAEGYINVEFINKVALQTGGSEVYRVRISRAGLVRLDFNESLFTSVAGFTSGVDQRSTPTD